jgi:hypothetical protein
MKIPKQFIIANLSRNLKSKIDSGEIEVIDFNERSDREDYPSEVVNFIESYENKVVSVSDEEYYKLFHLSLFRENDVVLESELFNHVFWEDQIQSKGEYYIQDSRKTLVYVIREYYMLTNTYYIANCPHYEYFFKLDKNGNLLLPEFTDWEIDQRNVIDNALTREIFLEIL